MRRRSRINVGKLFLQLGAGAAAARNEIPSEFRVTAQQVARAEDRVCRAKEHVKQIKEEVTEAVLDAAQHHVKEVATELRERKRARLLALVKHRILKMLSSPALLALCALLLLAANLLVFLISFVLFQWIGTAILLTFITAVLSAACLVISKAIFNPTEGDVAALYQRLQVGVPAILSLETRLGALRARYRRLSDDHRWLSEFSKATRQYDKLRRIAGSQRYRLLHADWRSLRGIPFEEFVANVFEMLGYRVSNTKVSGDQGIDLIAEGNGRRIGIQCKGYSASVGNHAVQEAYAGKQFYLCDTCIVITNNLFTRGAIELAKKVDCELIDERQIVSLILGRLF